MVARLAVAPFREEQVLAMVEQHLEAYMHSRRTWSRTGGVGMGDFPVRRGGEEVPSGSAVVARAMDPFDGEVFRLGVMEEGGTYGQRCVFFDTPGFFSDADARSRAMEFYSRGRPVAPDVIDVGALWSTWERRDLTRPGSPDVWWFRDRHAEGVEGFTWASLEQRLLDLEPRCTRMTVGLTTDPAKRARHETYEGYHALFILAESRHSARISGCEANLVRFLAIHPRLAPKMGNSKPGGGAPAAGEAHYLYLAAKLRSGTTRMPPTK